MKLAVSNIAWNRWDDPEVFALLKAYGVTGIEAAPGKFSGLDLEEVRRCHEEAGFSIPALQAILFGSPALQVFDRGTYDEFFAKLESVAKTANSLGAKVLVFGAPKNRRRFGMPLSEASEIAAGFFRKAGDIVAREGCVIGLEANPVEYQCDFLTNVADVREFVRLVNSNGVKVHFDSGAVLLNRGRIADEIADCDFVHYHISAPQLANVADFADGQAEALRLLKTRGYDGWVSIEMKRGEPELQYLERALGEVRGWIDEAES